MTGIDHPFACSCDPSRDTCGTHPGATSLGGQDSRCHQSWKRAAGGAQPRSVYRLTLAASRFRTSRWDAARSFDVHDAAVGVVHAKPHRLAEPGNHDHDSVMARLAITPFEAVVGAGEPRVPPAPTLRFALRARPLLEG